MRKIRRISAWILVVVLLCGQISTQAFAQEEQSVLTVSDEDAVSGDSVSGADAVSGGDEVSGADVIPAVMENSISMNAETSFGTILAKEFSEKSLEQKENNGYNVFSVEMQGNQAVVSFESVDEAVLVIGIYDETGAELLTLGSAEVESGETTAAIDFEAGSIPQYFYIRGFLVEPVTCRPLCAVYESPMYTKEMQEFLAKTTADFDADRVLNLDEDETNNFAVFGEETLLISGDAGQNNVVSADEANNTYVIENADNVVASLKPGDIFAYPYQDNDVLIVKVASIESDGTTVTITGADTSMEEVFDYIKIDTEMGIGEATVDASSCGEGVTYEGMVDYVEEDAPQVYALEGEGSIEKAFKYRLEEEFGSIDGINVKISGGLEMKLAFSVKIYMSLSRQYVELKFDYSAKVSASITGKASVEIPLVTVGFMPIAGVIVELTPSIVIDAKVTISLEGTLSGTVGFRAESGVGITNLTTYPKFKSSLKVEGSIFFGISLCPRIKIISEKVAAVSLKATLGAEVKASLKDPLKSDEENKKHTCTMCIAGEINGKFNISAGIEFLSLIKFSITPADFTIKIADFYYSADHGEFALSTCPYYLYKGKIIVLDNNWNPIQDAVIKTNGGIFTTNEEGITEVWFPARSYIFSVEKKGYTTVFRELTLQNGGENMLVILSKKSGESGDEGQRQKVVKVNSGSWWHSAAITEEGNLYLWGANSSGQLGNGTTDDSNTPIKVMKNVKEVSLGERYSAAITEGGDLYLWGSNIDGELGNGTDDSSNTPIKVMEHVKEVSLGWYHSAAITEEGNLYLWGDNYHGELGNGTTDDSNTPIKVMEHVKEISLACWQSAAITEEGDLYLWGYNKDGQLGNGATDDSNTPIKVMEHVKEVSLGSGHIAIITEEGDLYLWGFNDNGQLGNGTTDDSNTPIKVMEHVKEVSLGGWHSAAITEEGDLYLWGYNLFGQLGNGTTVDSHIPIKIDVPPITGVSTFSQFEAGKEDEIMFSDVQQNWNGTYFTALMSNETYNYYVMKNRDADNPFDSENLFYIGQAVSDERGTLNVDFTMKEAYADADIFAVPMHEINLSDAEVTVSDLTYNGGEQYAKVEVSYHGITLVEGLDYYVSGDYGVTQTGDYTLTVEGIGLYTGTVSVRYQMVSNGDSGGESESEASSESSSESSGEPSSESASESSSEPSSESASGSIDDTGLKVTFPEGRTFTYTGSAIKPAIELTNNGAPLIEGIDYTVKYSNNTKAGTAKLTVTGKGRFTGKQDATFTIEQKSLQDNDIEVGDIIIAENTKAVPIIYYNGIKLGNKDYTLEGDTGKLGADAIAPSIKVTGQSNYKDDITVKIKVVAKADMKKFSVTLGKEKLEYNGKPQRPTITLADKANPDKQFRENVDYKLVFNNNHTDAGTVKVTVIGMGEYSGSVTKSYKIAPSKEDMTLEFNKTKEYVFDSAGTTVDNVKVKNAKGDILEYGKDYKISYSANKKVGTGKINVTFLGNYKGSKAVKDTFTIKPGVLDDSTVNVIVPDKSYTGKKNAYKSVPLVTDKSGNALKSSDYTATYYADYEMTREIKGKENLIELEEGINSAAVYVKITGKGNYAGDTNAYARGEYNVERTTDSVLDLSKAKVTFKKEGSTVKKLEYTGDALEPDVEVTVKVKGAGSITLDESQYDIKWTNNINKGKATAVITGNGTEKNGYAFVGSKNATFSIVARNLKDEKNLFGTDNAAKLIKSIFNYTGPALNTY